MKAMQKIKVALALAAVLAMSSTAWAKPGGHGIRGDLNGNIVTLEVTVPAMTATAEGGLCDPANTAQTYSIKAYIFQPSGRMFAIGIGYNTETFTCDTANDQQIDLEVKVLPGLTLKPGPATLVYQVIQTTTNTSTGPTTPTTTVTDAVVYEYGSRVDLH